ncbi:ornithine decarboxylase [Mycena filopes]|nr:ornithine decarboxylase [Mycena filopes]
MCSDRLRLLVALGTGFDCASSGEIFRIFDLGVAPARIISANSCKPGSFVRHEGRLGVHAMTFDNADELYKIACAHPDAQLVVRILTDDMKSLGLELTADGVAHAGAAFPPERD